MKKYSLENFTRGWMVGNFEPNIIKTDLFEFMVRSYIAGDLEKKHIHKLADEITIVTSGTFKMNGELLMPGDIAHLAPGEPGEFECIENGTIAVVKTPSAIGDKYLC